MVAIKRRLRAVRLRMARYRRFLAQPGRMSGERIAFGNRR